MIFLFFSKLHCLFSGHEWFIPRYDDSCCIINMTYTIRSCGACGKNQMLMSSGKWETIKRNKQTKYDFVEGEDCWIPRKDS